MRRILALALWVGLCSAAAADDRLAVGDTVAFAALGAPTLSQRATIGVDGMISLAPVGRIRAAGLTPAELEERVKALVATRPVRLGGSSSASELVTIDPQAVTLTLAEYRPVYIDGDVARPGVVAFVPGLTVRQAVALAGGFSTAVIALPNPVLASAELRADYERLWTQSVTVAASIARLEAEISGTAMAPLAPPAGAAVAADALAAIEGLERDKMAARLDELHAAQRHLADARAVLAQRIDVLTQQRAREEESAAADLADVKRISDLYDRRLVPYERVVDTRRIALLSATRALQIGAQVEELRADDESLARDQDKFANERRVALIDELQQARATAATVQADLQAVRDKLLFTGQLRTDMERLRSAARYAVVRQTADGDDRVAADDATALQPGDVVAVTLPADLGAEAASQ